MQQRKKPEQAKRILGADSQKRDIQVMSGLIASQHLSERHDGKYARALIWGIVAMLGAFVYWAAITPVYEIVTGEGTIRPEGLSTRIEHRDGGIVAQIKVAEGDRVAAGDVIAQLDVADLHAELEKLRASLSGIDARVARHRWLLSLDLANDASPHPAGLEVPPTFTEDISYRKAQLETMRARRNVAEANRQALATQRRTANEELVILRGQLDRYQRPSAANVVTLARREELHREILRLQSTIAQLEGDMAIQVATIAQMQSSQAELIAQFRREARLQLQDDLEEQIATQQSILQIEDRLARNILLAPVAGTVNGLTVQNSGEVLGAGEILAEIIPAGAKSYAEIEIPADRIGGVEIGHVASVKVLTYDFTRFGDIPAIVERISPSSFVKDNGDVVFRVQLSFAQDHLTTAGAVQRITPGMTISADIRSEKRTILSYLLKPVRVIADGALTEA
ncbi:HlyD family type I secretion periplasmic adaptor subunit [Yoonia sp. SS1-5]|uniref:Membrane fusion protein (MFP) family protein n=1 Tax=Yoonia rhodophyticola TaxID=3137370 RepID=A0AAN0NJ85_9RHOB